MMRARLIVLAALFLLLPGAAVRGESYLVEPNLAAAQAISQARCQALGCDGVRTVYWWTMVPGPSGQYALRIESTAGAFDQTGLTPGNILALQTRAALIALGWTLP